MLSQLMNHSFKAQIIWISFSLILSCNSCSDYHKIENIREKFNSPPSSYLPTVYWFWNGDISEDKIESQLHEMKKSNTVGSVCILGWEGLSTEYLSDQWFEKVKFACKVAKDVGLDIWLYDELRWPSGHAGGKVLESNPEYKSKCLSRHKWKEKGPKKVNIPVYNGTVAIIAARLGNSKIMENSLTDISGLILQGVNTWSIPEGEWEIHVFSVEECAFRTTFTDLKYVDLLDNQAVNKFISITYDEYYKRMPEYFGDVIKAVITDEPGVYCGIKEYFINPETIPWTPSLFDQFKIRKGYDLKKYLPALWEDIGNQTIKIRTDFYSFYSELFEETYFKNLRQWCDDHRIKLNIQPSHEESLKYATRMMGNYFKVMQYSNLPGADEVYFWDKQNITPKIASSAARSFGYLTTYCEVFAAYGWDMTLAKMKGISDWLFTRGINRLQLSAYYFAMDGNWRFEIPPSLFFQNPFWEYMPHYSEYVSRLTYMLSQGQQVVPIAMLYPIQTAMGVLSASNDSIIDQIDKDLKQLSTLLLQNQYDYNFIDETSLEEKILIIKNDDKTVLRMQIGSVLADFELLILPNVSILSKKSLDQIKLFYKNGGKIIAFGSLPKLTPDGNSILDKTSDIWKESSSQITIAENEKGGAAIFIKNEMGQVINTIGQYLSPDIRLKTPQKNISYIHSKKDKMDVYYLTNSDTTSIQTEISFSVKGTPQIWNPENGHISMVSDFWVEDQRTKMPLNLDGYGSVLVVFDKARDNLPSNQELGLQPETIFLNDLWEFSLMDSNHTPEWRRSGSWTVPQTLLQKDGSMEAPAYPYFSGTAIYQQQFHYDHFLMKGDRKYILDAGSVKNILEVWLNGRKVGVRCWPPYQADISDFLVEGENELKLLVTNTMANRYKKIQKSYPTGEQWGKVLPSGLLDPVRIEIFDLVKR
jgi:hypothetical protein